MRRTLMALVMLALIAAPSWAAKKKAAKAKGGGKAASGAWKKTPGLYATFSTSHGDFVCSLFEKESPETVAIFTGLAIGDREFTDPKDGEAKKGRFYDGLAIHRVVPNYIIQGGDPKGDSTGGPGFQFDDEINGLKFDKPGRLAMANSGANTNGSQFFITASAVPALDDKVDADGNVTSHYTIFGQVVDGQKVVDAISNLKAEAEKPAEPVVIRKLDVVRVDKKGRAAPLTKAPIPPSEKPEEEVKEETKEPAATVAEEKKPAAKKKAKAKKKKKR